MTVAEPEDDDGEGNHQDRHDVERDRRREETIDPPVHAADPAATCPSRRFVGGRAADIAIQSPQLADRPGHRRRQRGPDGRGQVEPGRDLARLDAHEGDRPREQVRQLGGCEQVVDPGGQDGARAVAVRAQRAAAPDRHAAGRAAHEGRVDEDDGAGAGNERQEVRGPAFRRRPAARPRAGLRRRTRRRRSSSRTTCTPTPSSRRRMLPMPRTTSGPVSVLIRRVRSARPRRRATRGPPRGSGT